MGKIFRVDERLVHGQTINYWCTYYNISKIFVANDELVEDELKKLFFKIATSDEVELEFLTIKQSTFIEDEKETNYMILFKSIEDVVRFAEGEGIIDKLIVSNVSYGEEKTKVNDGVFLSGKEMKSIRVLENNYNINIIYKLMPN
ncbi:PTS sugar transporter subunit IIB [Clostridium hydrogeniformans]|uniref:PTS sugar transporter subunit IIB n=1 Tax=Clostridium hydrogeniformans TaxID=349933 RepID=UPI00048286E4|nr:PTS sugar transporter subunit IIB [Clostridium hydrogeniformans]